MTCRDQPLQNLEGNVKQEKRKVRGLGKGKGKAEGKWTDIMQGWLRSVSCLVVMLPSHSLPVRGFPNKIESSTPQGLDLVIQRRLPGVAGQGLGVRGEYHLLNWLNQSRPPLPNPDFLFLVSSQSPPPMMLSDSRGCES